jgi:hypothetical protein
MEPYTSECIIRFLREPYFERGPTSARDTGEAGRLRFAEERCRCIERERVSSSGVVASSLLLMVP